MSSKLPYTPVETLQSALAYLMSRHNMIMAFQLQGCPACSAMSIAQHLELLIDHPELNSTILRGTYNSLLADWQGLAEHHEQQAAMQQLNKNRQYLQIH
jgi:hypothetical protein